MTIIRGFCFRGGRLAVVWLVMVAASAAASADQRVAIVVSAAERSADWQAVLSVDLIAARPATKLVERGELARLWAERERAALTARSDTGLSLPAPVNIDRYLHFRRVVEGRWIVELVDAADGRALGSFAVEAADVSSASRLTAAASRLLDAPTSAIENAAPRVAVVESASAPEDSNLFGLAARLRSAFAGQRLVVLDRALTQDVVVEQNDEARGMREATSAAALLALDYYLEISPRDIRVVRMRDGVVLGVSPRRPLDSNELSAIQQWALPILGRPAVTLTEYLPQVESEALEPFYRGLARYDAGDFLEALGEFQAAYGINDRFRAAYEWEARCYDSLDMPQVATALRRYLEVAQFENLSAASARTEAASAIAFLGIEDGAAVPSVLGLRLGGVVASVLANRSDTALILPDQLSRLRREYDWLISAAMDARQPQAPPLFCRHALVGRLRQDASGPVVNFIRRDLVVPERTRSRQLQLGNDPAVWPERLRVFFDSRPFSDPEPVSGVKPVTSPAPDTAGIRRLASVLGRARGPAANLARIRLALADPGHPLLTGRPFIKGQERTTAGLEGFLEHGFREWRIARLPPGHLHRRWLEIDRAQDYLGPFSIGRQHSGADLNVDATMEAIVSENPLDAPGLVARYLLAYDHQGLVPPADTLATCASLAADLERSNPADIPEYRRLKRAVAGIGRVAAIANGEIEGTYEFSLGGETPRPRRFSVEWQADGNPRLTIPAGAPGLEHLKELPPDERPREARIAQLIYSKGPQRFGNGWLREYPRSSTLSGQLSEWLHVIEKTEGLPLSHPFDWDGERAHILEAVAYIADEIEYRMGRTATPYLLKRLGDAAGNFSAHLNNACIRELVTDLEYEAYRSRLAAAYAQAGVRLGYKETPWPRVEDWRVFGRDLARRLRRDNLWHAGRWLHNVRELDRLVAEAETAPDLKVWWRALRLWDNDYAFTASQFAAHYSRRAPEVLATFSKKSFSAEEAGLVFEQALWLHFGRREVEAEPLYRMLLDPPVPATPPAAPSPEIQANAAFRLAQIARAAGRVPEAVAYASRGLVLCAGRAPRLIGGRYDATWNESNLPALLGRLLRELRFDPARAPIPPGAAVVSVPTENGDNPVLHVFYRLPPPAAAAAGGPPRILLFCPVNNEDALDYLRPESEWARFASDNGLLLVVPQLYESHGANRVDHRFSHPRHAQVWSGDAVLRAIEQIARVTPLRRDAMLLHGQASGSGFAATFAAWRPDLVAAVSILNGNWGLPRYTREGLQPMSALRHIAYRVSAAEDDRTYDRLTVPRYDVAVDFVTRMRGAGVGVEWRSWPAAGHAPTFAMESECREFLARRTRR